MPIFTSQLSRLDPNNVPKSLESMANHIRYIQEQLEWTLMNLDSTNITEIETDITNVTSSSGGVNFTGNSITLKGANGETFEAGVPEGSNVFHFKLTGRNGSQIFYFTSAGELVITDKATISLDCGEW